MTSSVSTCFLSSAMPISAVRMRREPSNRKGLVTTATVRMPKSLATRAITQAAPVPVPPPMPAAMNTMLQPAIAERISSMASSAACWPMLCLEPAPRPSVSCRPSCTRCSALEASSAWASVLATMNSAPVRPAAIMLLTAFPPAPPTPITAMRGFIVVCPSKAFSEPLPHALQVAACLAAAPIRARACARIEGRVNEADGRRERGTVEPGRHVVERLDPGDAYGARKEIGRQLTQPNELASPAGQHHALHDNRGNAGTLDPAGDMTEETQHPATYNGPHLTLGDLAAGGSILPRQHIRDRLAVVGRNSRYSAIFLLDSLGFVSGS